MKAMLQTLRARWDSLPPRDKRGAGIGGWFVLLALIWFVALAPALHTVRTSTQQHQLLDVQLGTMQTLAARASALQGKPVVTTAQAASLLETHAKAKLGVSINVTGEQGLVSFKAVSGEALAQFLALARTACASAVIEARLTQGITPQGQLTWDGTLSLQLPSAP